MEGGIAMEEREFLACCGSTRFAKEMVAAAPFSTVDDAFSAARDIWFNKVDVNGWLEAFAAHPQIGESSPSLAGHRNPTSAQWSKGEQSTALATATNSTLQELYDWNSRYRQKFGFVFLIFASGRSTPEILAELKRRYKNRPLVEFENAAVEQMKITELRLSKLFSSKAAGTLRSDSQKPTHVSTNAEDRLNIIGSHLTAPEASSTKPAHIPKRTRPPITTHVLDIARGSPANGIEVKLEVFKGNQQLPKFGDSESHNWVVQGCSVTDKDGRSGQLMNMVEELKPGAYRISFNTGQYLPGGFFPYVSIVFEVKESQKWEHFHVPLLLSPFSFSTYRGS